MAAIDRIRPDGKRALQALSSAALSLPAYATAPPTEGHVDYHFIDYREADLRPSQAAGSQRSRYAVSGHKLRTQAPLSATMVLRSDLTVESMSGASPWWVQPDANGKPVQVLSGASIADNRQDLNASLSHYGQQRVTTVTLGHSNEDDYRANYAGLYLSMEPSGSQFNAAFGINFSDDELRPTEGGSERFPDRIRLADKTQLGLQASLTRILARHTVMQLGVSYQRNAGFLSDPYKLVYVDGTTVADARPRERRVGAWFLRWRRHFQALKAAWHLDYRGTADDWDVQTTTVETRWVQRLAARWRLSAALRYYSQSQAGFYAPFFAQQPADGYMTSDYRLSPYGAASIMLQLNAKLGAWDLGLGVEQYDASADYALQRVEIENPGLVGFRMLNMRLAYRFE